ncbi:NAD-dependent epimerase/dehydratase family protein [Demequina sp. NBRC 110056]|uniref:NAD-dependent epimerase/dehydratase family protein n=1 Tax=Demequina sp. NBRC 110056 TaxID=1570345 RepID=UPI000A071C14|nr:NAD-dependent epimerase/dehydratase family protein [Demequina sp. NBRC 110056]
MRVLFIGGTGLISSACSPLAIERGMDLTLVNRGASTRAAAPDGARVIHADIHDVDALRAAVKADVAEHGEYDAVVQWIAFTPDHVAQDVETFAGLTRQYVFISSASAYETPPSRPVVREDSTPLSNPYWQYSRDKAACEADLREAGDASGFPFTIVRPSHTYGYSDIVFGITSWSHPWTIADRLRRGAPILVHGDGTSLWTVTDHRDFAVGLVGLLGNPAALHEDFHITGDDVLSWNQIHEHVAAAVGVSADALEAQTVRIPTDTLIRFDREAFEGPLKGDKTNAAIFDTSKLRAAVPDFATRHRFADAIHESIAWFEADESRRGIDEEANASWDRIAAAYTSAVDGIFEP